MFQIFLLSFAVTASADKMSPFIVGGNEVSIKDWSFIAFVQITDGSNVAACGGSLLSSQTVLTAAHCLDDFTEKKKVKGITFTIYMGHSSFAKATMTRSVLDYESHKYYSPDSEIVQFDIGIMFLSRPVKFGSKVIKTILQPKFSATVDKKLAVAGWGYTDIDELTGAVSDRLKAVVMRPISSKICKLQTGIICTQTQNEFPYNGDSGGPLVNAKTHLQVGIVSFREMHTGISAFTSVPHYWDWINKAQLKLYKRFCIKGK
ncbi:chymotrypsin BII-like [Cydia splendana]|uniref:chymotrypsin BII-like n=1 Tax=Cydia splendana TaxID=1100963 RepID=UPI0028F4BC66